MVSIHVMEAVIPRTSDDPSNKVAGAMNALSLTPGREEEADMDLDVELGSDTSSAVMDAHMARGTMKEYSIKLATLVREKMRLTSMMKNLSGEEAVAGAATIDKLNLDIAEAKSNVKEWNEMLDDLEDAERSMGRTAPSSITPTISSGMVGVKKGDKIEELKLSNEFPRYHRMVEPHLLPVLDIKIHGRLITNVREFLHEFHRIGVTKFTAEDFDRICCRLLCLANMDRKASDAMNAVLSRDPLVGNNWPWAKCEKAFVESAMTQTERTEEVEKLFKMGREKSESFQQYYHRMKRLMEVYQVKDLPKFADLLFMLQRAVEPEILTMILLTRRIAVLERLMGVTELEEPTFETHLDGLQSLQGPADCDEWAPVLTERKRLTGVADMEAAKQAQSLKDKLLYQQKKAAAAATLATTGGARVGGTNGGSINQVPASGDRPFQQTNAGFGSHRGAFGNGNGFGASRGRGGGHGRGGFKKNFTHGQQPYPSRGQSNGKLNHADDADANEEEDKVDGVEMPDVNVVRDDFQVGDSKMKEEEDDVTDGMEDHVINYGSLVLNSIQGETSLDESQTDKDVPVGQLPSLPKMPMVDAVVEKINNVSVVNTQKEETVVKEKKKKAKGVAKIEAKSRLRGESGLGMRVHVGSLPVHPLDGGEGSGSAKVALDQAKMKYGAMCMVEEDKDDAQAEYNIEDVVDDEYIRAFERFSITDNPLTDACDGYPLFTFGDNDFELVKKHYGSSKRKNQPDNRLFVPIYLNNERHLALIDTGATHSFISAAVVKKYSIPVKPMEGYIELANASVIERVGETENVEIVCGQNVLCAPYEVIEQSHAVTIGMDLFHRYGFNIVGLPDAEESSERMPAPVEDEKPTLIPLTVPEREKTQEFIAEKDAFMKSIEELLRLNAKIPNTSHCTIPEMKVYLPVPDDVTLYRRPKVFAASQMPILDEAVENWLKDDVITLAPAGNPHNNTLTLAAKKDANGNKTLYRVCLDPRPLNAHLPDDNFPVPLISDIMKFAGGNAVFSTVDLKQAYHRLPIHEEDQPLTAFMHDGKQYMFKKAPFGLKPLSSLFQRGMSRILGDLKFVRNFIDDILIASRNRHDHAIQVRMVIKRLTDAKLIINREKCKFYSTQVALLGFIVDLDGKRIDPNKLVNIRDWQPPTTGKQVQSYMGTFNFFRDQVPLIATIAAPLDALRNTPGPFTLNAAQLKSFEALKNLLVLAPIIHFVDFDLPLHVATDASNVGLGAVLYQLPEGEANPKNIKYISFVARSLQPSERRYSTTQKELLAIVFALKKLHYYLWGRHFTLYTDHRALTFMHSQKEMNSMLTAWQETILDYTFKVVYRPGVLNVLPDALSRQFPQELWTNRTLGTAPSKIYGYVHLIQDADTQRVTVGISDRKGILVDAHALGHIGANAMVKHIHSLQKTWPNLAKDCLEYVQRCQECQRVNIARKGYHPLSAIHAQLPGEHMAVDLTGPFPVESDGNRFLLILVDVCTRFVFLEAIPDKKAITVAKVLFKIFTTIGFPRILQSDNGSEFVNEAVKVMTTTMGVEHRLLTPYHPRGNGVAENHVKTACNIIRKEVKDHKQAWAKHVPMAQLAMNTRIVALHNSSPFSLFFARRFNGISNFSDTTEKLSSQEELLKRLEYMTKTVFPAIDTKTRETQRRMIERFNRTVLHSEFPDGSKVMSLDPIMGDKLTPRYEGPYTVVKRTTGGSYVLKDATGEELGRNFAPSQLKLVLDDYDATETYVVEKILNHRQGPGGGMEYRVKWKGYKEETWEPQENFIERKCITDYWKIDDQPGSRSLTQPRQTAATLGTRGQEQELSPLQCQNVDKTTKNISNSDAQKKATRKRMNSDDQEEEELIDRRRSRRLRRTNTNDEKRSMS
jgi:hypothetical protein